MNTRSETRQADNEHGGRKIGEEERRPKTDRNRLTKSSLAAEIQARTKQLNENGLRSGQEAKENEQRKMRCKNSIFY
jgi:hypothetical protein